MIQIMLLLLIFLSFSNLYFCNDNLWEEIKIPRNLDNLFETTQKITTLFKHQSTLDDGYLIPYIPTLEELRYELHRPLIKKLKALNYSIDINWEQIKYVEKYYLDYVDWWPLCVKIHVVSNLFHNKTTDERHAMVHEALKEEMTKREAGCAIDIHADTPEEWNEFKARNDFDEVKGQVDLRARSLKKSTPITKTDLKLKEKIYKYLKMHFEPLHLHVVDSKDLHPVDNDNPAFDVLLVSHLFNNLTITQRTLLVHDYLRDFINEGIQFRLHNLQSPEEVYPDRFNEDGMEAAAFSPVYNMREHFDLNRIYQTPPKSIVELENKLQNNISIIADAKRKLREYDRQKQTG